MNVNSIIVEGTVIDSSNDDGYLTLKVEGPKGDDVYLPVVIGTAKLKLRVVGRLQESSGLGLYIHAEYIEALKNEMAT